jgi:hypothetical protein
MAAAFLAVYSIAPDDLERALVQRLADAQVHGQMPWRVLAAAVPYRRWIELFGCDASVDGLLVPGAHELPPLVTDAPPDNDAMALALWQACWHHVRFVPEDAAARAAMLLAQADWFPVAPGEPRHVQTCQAAVVATNKRKANEVRAACAQWTATRGRPQLRQFVTDNCAPWLGEAMCGHHRSRLRQWARTPALGALAS